MNYTPGSAKGRRAARLIPKIREELQRRENPRRRRRAPVHTAVFDRCVEDVRARGTAANPFAVCTATLGKRAVKKSHRRRRSSNPRRRREAGRWVILARHARKPTHVFHGDRFVSERSSRPGSQGTVYFPSRELAARFARHLKRMFPTRLKGWRLRVTTLHPMSHPNAD